MISKRRKFWGPFRTFSENSERSSFPWVFQRSDLNIVHYESVLILRILLLMVSEKVESFCKIRFPNYSVVNCLPKFPCQQDYRLPRLAKHLLKLSHLYFAFRFSANCWLSSDINFWQAWVVATSLVLSSCSHPARRLDKAAKSPSSRQPCNVTKDLNYILLSEGKFSMKPEKAFQVQEFKLVDTAIFSGANSTETLLLGSEKLFTLWRFFLLKENFVVFLLLFHAASRRVALCTHVRVSNLRCQRNTPKCAASLSSQRSSSRPIFANDRSRNFALSHFRSTWLRLLLAQFPPRLSHYILFTRLFDASKFPIEKLSLDNKHDKNCCRSSWSETFSEGFARYWQCRINRKSNKISSLPKVNRISS